MTTPYCNRPETYARRFRPSKMAVPESRKLLDAYLKDKGLDHLRDDGRTVLTELLTNALRVTPPDGWVAVRLRRSPRGNLLIDVWDPSTLQPILQSPGLLDETGRGLHIVRALSVDFQVCPFGGGKYVRAELAG